MLFEQEREKILVYLIKNKIQIPNLVKKLKNIVPEAREAIIKRYFLKCRISHCERFFDWRRSYLKLTFDQRILLDELLREAYQNNADFSSHKVKSFKEISLPLNVGVSSPDLLL